MSKNKVVKELKEYGKIVQAEYKDTESDIQDPNKHPIEFLFGVILDQGIPYKRAWKAPYELKRRLGHLNVRRIERMNQKRLEKIMFQKPALHRYRKTSNWLVECCKLLISKYNGNPRNIWNNKPTIKQLEERFREFKSIGQKKGSMAVNILVRDFEIPVSGSKNDIDISYDIHVRRVFLRTGLSEKDLEENILKVARKLNPEYPGELDWPSWEIGRKWCHYNNPNHINCPLKNVCPKLDVKVPRE